MKISYLLLSFLLCTFFTSITAIADAKIDIKYNGQTDFLVLKVNDAYLDDVLNRLSEQVGFTLSQDGDFHRIINLTMEGTSRSVILTLVKSSSVVLAQSDISPHKVTRLILLPAGKEQSDLPRKVTLRGPPISDNPEENKQRQELMNRRIKNNAQGLGRRNNSESAPGAQINIGEL